MDADLKKIKKLTLFMKKEGLLELKHADIELKLSPHAFHGEQSKLTSDPTLEETTPKYDSMSMALWSSPDYLPEEAN